MNTDKRYLKVYEQVREDIINGRYPVGSKLPSKRVMAESMGMSVITIEHAYELLSEEGYIVPRQKSGYFVSFDDSDIYTGSENGNYSVPQKNKSDYGVKFPVASDAAKKEEGRLSSKAGEPRFSYSIYAKTVRKVLSDFDDYIMQKSPKSGLPEL